MPGGSFRSPTITVNMADLAATLDFRVLAIIASLTSACIAYEVDYIARVLYHHNTNVKTKLLFQHKKFVPVMNPRCMHVCIIHSLHRKLCFKKLGSCGVTRLVESYSRTVQEFCRSCVCMAEMSVLVSVVKEWMLVWVILYSTLHSK